MINKFRFHLILLFYYQYFFNPVKDLSTDQKLIVLLIIKFFVIENLYLNLYRENLQRIIFVLKFSFEKTYNNS